VLRLGRRCGAWCDLPFRLSHDRLAELIGATRVTTTRLMSQFRLAQLLERRFPKLQDGAQTDAWHAAGRPLLPGIPHTLSSSGAAGSCRVDSIVHLNCGRNE
jgi:hypothetical protein